MCSACLSVSVLLSACLPSCLPPCLPDHHHTQELWMPKLCAGCRKEKGRKLFSSAQWKKGNARVCRTCRGQQQKVESTAKRPQSKGEKTDTLNEGGVNIMVCLKHQFELCHRCGVDFRAQNYFQRRARQAATSAASGESPFEQIKKFLDNETCQPPVHGKTTKNIDVTVLSLWCDSPACALVEDAVRDSRSIPRGAFMSAFHGYVADPSAATHAYTNYTALASTPPVPRRLSRAQFTHRFTSA